MKNHSILLISANRFDKPYPVFPLGIAYLSSYIKEKLPHYSIDIFDLYSNDLEQLREYISEKSPKYIGVSLRNVDSINSLDCESFIDWYQQIIACIKQCSEATLIIGGAGFSIFPEKIFEALKPDYGINGEGEESLVKLISHLDRHEDVTEIEGLVYTKDGKPRRNERRNFCRDINLQLKGEAVDLYWQRSGMLNIQSKRGCPYKCIYCTYPVIEGRKIRVLQISQIVSTLVDLYTNKGIDYVFFTDSVFNIENKFNYELAEQIISSGIKIKWGAYFSIKNLDEKLLLILKKSGLTHIEFGTESLSDSTLKHYRKPFTVQDVVDVSALCTRLEIDFVHFLILGGYGETEQSLKETFDNCKRIGRTAFFPFIGMRIYPGTELYEIALREEKIDKDDDLVIPKYYFSDAVDLSDLNALKARAVATGKNWVFPDANFSELMDRLRKKNKKGPLWEYSLK